MYLLDLNADNLVDKLLALAESDQLALLDSCGVGHVGSHLLVAGISPTSSLELRENDPQTALKRFSEIVAEDHAAVFTLSYEFGEALALGNLSASGRAEPDIFISTYDVLVIHDYDSGQTYLTGDSKKFAATETMLREASTPKKRSPDIKPTAKSDFSRSEYYDAIETIKERIRSGDTYQTNLTRKIIADLPVDFSAEDTYRKIRSEHPAPFSAFIVRPDSIVISASPERFFKIENGTITVSPIKGTRPRGTNAEEDMFLRQSLVESSKDRAENTMIVDLLRNDLGRVCEFGSVVVEKLCDIEEHPTLFHLVSTVSGKLRNGITIGDILRSLFPCGSITGAPKISTMRIIREIERSPRGLSMGAIGYRIPKSFGIGESIDLSVAIRTMVIRDNAAEFNVGGGIVIDSDPESEFEETETKAKVLMNALGL